MTILQNEPHAPENRSQPHPRPPEPHLRDVSRGLPPPRALDREHDPLDRDLVAREVSAHELLGRDVRARDRKSVV